LILFHKQYGIDDPDLHSSQECARLPFDLMGLFQWKVQLTIVRSYTIEEVFLKIQLHPKEASVRELQNMTLLGVMKGMHGPQYGAPCTILMFLNFGARNNPVPEPEPGIAIGVIIHQSDVAAYCGIIQSDGMKTIT
jgi:hypothetical protein